jgi:hypothetical protein
VEMGVEGAEDTGLCSSTYVETPTDGRAFPRSSTMYRGVAYARLRWSEYAEGECRGGVPPGPADVADDEGIACGPMSYGAYGL